MAILVYGSLVPDIVFAVPRVPHVGEDVPASDMALVAAGGGGNVAVALAGWGYDVVATGNSVGNDPLGAWVSAELSGRGVRLPAGFISASGFTAANGILVTPDGQRTIVGSDYLRVTWQPVESWEAIGAVMVDGYSGAAGTEVIAAASRRSLPVVGADRTPPGLAGMTLLLWSADEHPDPEEAAAAAATGPWVVVTNGPDPVSVFGPDGLLREIAPLPRPARDSTGAGDVFAAAVTAGLADGLGRLAAIEQAVDVASRYVEGGRDRPVPPLTTLHP